MTQARFTIHVDLDFYLSGQRIASQVIGRIAARDETRAQEVLEYCCGPKAQTEYLPLRERALRAGYEPNVRFAIVDNGELEAKS